MSVGERDSVAIGGPAVAPGVADVVLRLMGLLGLALLYFGAAKVGLSLAITTEQVTAVWPPTGIALAAVLLMGYGVWPALAAGAFLANVTANEPVAVAAGAAAGNTLEALAGAWIVRRAVGDANPLQSLRGVLAWVLGAALLATLIAATLGSASLCLGGVQEWSHFSSLWWLWWLGDATGALLVGSLLMAWSRWRKPTWSGRRTLEALALAGSVAVIGTLIFRGPYPSRQVGYGLVYGMIPIVCWSALRFGPRGVTVVSGVASGFAIWFTAGGAGPFATGDVHASLILLQVFTAVVATTGLVLAGADADRRAVERALRESELRYSSVVEAVPGILYTATPEGQTDFINQVFYDFTGLAPSSGNGLGWTTALHPDDLQRTRTRWQSSVTTGTPFEIEFRLREFDGLYRWFTSRSLPVRDGHDRILMWVGACIDIDAQKQAVERLREAEQRKDQVLAGLGEELRDPLAPIRHAVQSLDALPQDERELRRMAGVIEREVGQMASVIDDLLDVSRISQGRARLHTEPCDLTAIAEGALERCRAELAWQEVTLKEALPGAPLRCLGDPRRLAQIVDHMVRSAAGLTEPGGTVEFELTADADGAGARVVVRHTGTGLEADSLPRLFEMANAPGAMPAGHRRGLALSLVLVRSLVEMHGGRIVRLNPEPGAASAFGVWLPLRGVPAGDDALRVA